MPEDNEQKKVSDLFEELKKELPFLPDNDAVKEGYLFGLIYNLIN